MPAIHFLLGEDGRHDMSVDVGEAIVTALEFEGELLVIDAEKVEHGGLQVMNVDAILGDVKADLIALAVGYARLNAATSHPEREGVGVMVATPAWSIVEVALDEGSAPEFSAPDHEGVIEQAALLEIGDEAGGRLVGVVALVVEFRGEGVVLIPTCVHQLHKTGAALDEAAGEKAVACEGAGFVHLWAVKIERGFGFSRDVGEFGHASLHAVGHFILGNAGRDFGVSGLGELGVIELGNAIEHLATKGRIDAVGILEVEDRAFSGTEFDALVAGRQEAGTPVAVVENLSAARVLGDRGHDDEGREVFVHAAQSVAEPGAGCGAARELVSAEEEVDRRGMVDLFGVHAFDEAKVIGNGGGMGHQGAHPGTTFAMLFEGLDGSEEASFVRGRRHGAEALAVHVTFRDRFAVEFGELRFVIPELEMSGPSVLEKVDDALRLGREAGDGRHHAIFRAHGIFAEKGGEGCDAEAVGAFAKEVAAIDGVLVFKKWVHGYSLVSASSVLRMARQTVASAACPTAGSFGSGGVSPMARKDWAASGSAVKLARALS